MAQKKKYPDTVYVPNMVIMFDNVTSLLQGVFLEVLSSKISYQNVNASLYFGGRKCLTTWLPCSKRFFGSIPVQLSSPNITIVENSI